MSDRLLEEFLEKSFLRLDWTLCGHYAARCSHLETLGLGSEAQARSEHGQPASRPPGLQAETDTFVDERNPGQDQTRTRTHHYMPAWIKISISIEYHTPYTHIIYNLSQHLCYTRYNVTYFLNYMSVFVLLCFHKTITIEFISFPNMNVFMISISDK